MAQLLYHPLYRGLALTAVFRDGVDDDSLHVAGQGNTLHSYDHLLLQHCPRVVLWVRGVRHFLLHVDVRVECQVLTVHLHESVLGVDHGFLRGVADPVSSDESLYPVGQAPVAGDDPDNEMSETYETLGGEQSVSNVLIQQL